MKSEQNVTWILDPLVDDEGNPCMALLLDNGTYVLIRMPVEHCMALINAFSRRIEQLNKSE